MPLFKYNGRTPRGDAVGGSLESESAEALANHLFARGITPGEYNALANDIDAPLLNRALRGAYPSGSTIKPVLGLAALTDHAITADTKVFCNAVFSLPGSRHVWRADKDEPRGYLDMPEAIARSSDVYFYRLASTLGIDRIAAFLERFGYGQPTGIDIGGGDAATQVSRNVLHVLRRLAVDVAWQVEVELISLDLCEAHHAGVFGNFELPGEDVHNLVDVLGA